MFYRLLRDPSPGNDLLPVVRQVSQDTMEQFGEATGNSGVIHLDYDYCRKQYPHGKTFVYAYLLLAWVSELMEQNFGGGWLSSGIMDMKFIGPAHPGQAFIVRGSVTAVTEEPDGQRIHCSCEVVNQDDGKAAVGTTSVLVPREDV